MRRLRPKVVALLAASCFVASLARADGLLPAEISQLGSGRTVTRNRDFHLGDKRYVGGVTYTVLDAQTGELSALLDDVDEWRRMLPQTRATRRVGTIAGDSLVQVTQGSLIFRVTYTLRLHRDASGIRFWMDPSRPHDIEDAWGFFRAQPLVGHQTLVTYGILIDMGPGLLRGLFEGRVRDLALRVPERLSMLLRERKTAHNENMLVRRATERY